MSFEKLVVAAVLLANPVETMISAGEPSRVSPRAESLDLLFDATEKPARIELRVDIDGHPLSAIWDESFARLTAYFDRDGDGSLDRTETGRLPPAFELRQLLWGKVASISGMSPPFAELDLDGDGKVSTAELGDCYRGAGLGGVVVGIGSSPTTGQLTAALLREIDSDCNGKTDQAEWTAAATMLAAHDTNDDELIGPGELVSRISYPGALGTFFLRPPAAERQTSPVAAALPFVVLPARLDDQEWVASVSARRRLANLPSINLQALATIREAPAAVAWHSGFGQNNTVATSRLDWGNGRLRLHLRYDKGKLDEQFSAARLRLMALHAELDSNSDQTLDEGEIVAPTSAPIKALFPAADRNGDSKLARDELDGWLDLQEQLSRGQVLLTILDHGAGLFELLDDDHDGALSVRELRSSWRRLQDAECVENGWVDVQKLPRSLLATLSRGQPLTIIDRQARDVPAWFSAMDRNGDGDLSPREFSGGRETFDRLDIDHDGLLSGEEAAQSDSEKHGNDSR